MKAVKKISGYRASFLIFPFLFFLFTIKVFGNFIHYVEQHKAFTNKQILTPDSDGESECHANSWFDFKEDSENDDGIDAENAAFVEHFIPENKNKYTTYHLKLKQSYKPLPAYILNCSWKSSLLIS